MQQGSNRRLRVNPPEPLGNVQLDLRRLREDSARRVRPVDTAEDHSRRIVALLRPFRPHQRQGN